MRSFLLARYSAGAFAQEIPKFLPPGLDPRRQIYRTCGSFLSAGRF